MVNPEGEDGVLLAVALLAMVLVVSTLAVLTPDDPGVSVPLRSAWTVQVSSPVQPYPGGQQVGPQRGNGVVMANATCTTASRCTAASNT